MSMPTNDRDDLVAQLTAQISKALQDAFYATVGAGVLTVQHLDGIRRQVTEQFTDRFGTQLGAGKDQVAQLVQAVEEQLRSVDDRVKVLEGQIDTLLGSVQDRLPEQAGEALARARKVSADARRAAAETVESLAGFVRSAAA
jgi:ABC-type transporter Mla subunit MlaD